MEGLSLYALLVSVTKQFENYKSMNTNEAIKATINGLTIILIIMRVESTWKSIKISND